MKMNLSEAGDDVEKDNSEWIRSNIPQYEIVWQKLIGNDGRCQLVPAEFSGISFEQRLRFAQAHYSLLVTLIALRDIAKDYDKLPTLNKTSDFVLFWRETVCFMAHLGRVRDLFKILVESFGLDQSIWLKFDSFYQTRNAVLHGPNIPIWTSDGLPLIPRIGDDKNGWNDKAFATTDTIDRKFAADFFSESLTELLQSVCAGLSSVLDRIEHKLGRKLTVLNFEPHKQHGHTSFKNLSDSSPPKITHSISGQSISMSVFPINPR